MSLPIAIQLYSVRNTIKNDVEGTLIALKEMGYDGVEFAGFCDKTPTELRDLCAKIGLVPISAHITYPAFKEETDKKIDEFVTLGVPYVAISYMPPECHKGGEAHEGVYETLKEMSAKLKARGIKLLYHNHNFEMVEYEGKRLYDWLFEAMDEDELQPQIDTGWIELEVGEAERYIRKFKNRCDIVHVKSYYGKEGFDELVHSPNEQKPRDKFDFCNYERGRLDVASIVKAAEESGAKWLVVEQDRPDEELSELESAKINIDYLRRL